MAELQKRVTDRCSPATVPWSIRRTWSAMLRHSSIGQSLFANYCAQCHGSTARGAPGFPESRRRRLDLRRRAGE